MEGIRKCRAETEGRGTGLAGRKPVRSPGAARDAGDHGVQPLPLQKEKHTGRDGTRLGRQSRPNARASRSAGSWSPRLGKGSWVFVPGLKTLHGGWGGWRIIASLCHFLDSVLSLLWLFGSRAGIYDNPAAVVTTRVSRARTDECLTIPSPWLDHADGNQVVLCSRRLLQEALPDHIHPRLSRALLPSWVCPCICSEAPGAGLPAVCSQDRAL